MQATKKMGLDEAIKALELPANCTFSDAKRAYKELIQVWHSDRHNHQPHLLERANQKTLLLNAAWEAISDTGEKAFNKRLHEKKSSQQTDSRAHATKDAHASNQSEGSTNVAKERRGPIKLNSFRPTGVVITPIWDIPRKSSPRAAIIRSTLYITAALLFAYGLWIAPQAIAQLKLSLLGNVSLGIVESCSADGTRATIIFDDNSIVKDIPKGLLPLAINDSGKVIYTCPDHVNILSLPGDPQHPYIGGSLQYLWVMPLTELVFFLISPLIILRMMRRKHF